MASVALVEAVEQLARSSRVKFQSNGWAIWL